MPLALALTTAQIDMLRTAAAPLPRPLRSRYLEMLGAALVGRDSVGDGELSRLAHAVVRELLAGHLVQRAGPRTRAEIRGWAVP
jgi:hypothetical protein